jgi:AcrR family transcriptional regulator
MTTAKQSRKSRKPAYRSPLREAQAAQTRERIASAAADLLGEGSTADSITFRAVAERAGVTEMTVYRHYPTRDALMQGLWRQLNARMAPGVGMPDSIDTLLAQHSALFTGFDRVAPQIVASIVTEPGREMRASLNEQRCKAFRGIAREAAPGLSPAECTRAAAVLQLLHSAHAWMSLREQWGLDGREIGAATRWAIETLLAELRRKA